MTDKLTEIREIWTDTGKISDWSVAWLFAEVERWRGIADNLTEEIEELRDEARDEMSVSRL